MADLANDPSFLKDIRDISQYWLDLSNRDFDAFQREYRDHPAYPFGSLGSEKVLEMLASKWKYPILIRLFKRQPMRYTQIKKELLEFGITNYMLTKSLRELEADGLILRKALPEVPPHTEYSVTQKAWELLIILFRMSEWYTRYALEALPQQENLPPEEAEAADLQNRLV